VFILTRAAQRALLVLLIAFTVIQGIAVIRSTTWPIEHWLGAW
jgi:hypothetical protein